MAFSPQSGWNRWGRIPTVFTLGGLLLAGLGAPASPLRAEGDLEARLRLSAARLSQPDYGIGTILADKVEPNWPGDVQGRLILAWTSLAEATGREPPQLAKLVAGLPATFNERGYLGPLLDPKAIDEQQLSGHGWLIAGLCRYAEYSGDPRPLAWARRMIQELALPLRGSYSRYPRTPDERNRAGGAVGQLTGRINNGWKLSTDIGCAYILLEGLVTAYHAMPSPELAGLIDEAGDAFLATDVVAVQAQAHASLCAARNLLLYDRLTGLRHGWLPKIEAFYRLYRGRAMTENEANWNWFGRPSWTEPCAIVDSFLLTLELWRITGRPAYLEDAHRIFYNALGYGQKPGGGFGCDAFNRDGGLALSNRHWNVPWCCNMRGACGLAGAAAARAEWRAGEGALFLPFYSNGSIRQAGWELEERTGWPIDETVEILGRRAAGGQPGLRKIAFFVPAEIPMQGIRVELDGRPVHAELENGFAAVELAGGTERFTLRLSLDPPLRTEAPHNQATRPGVVTVRYGFLVLGTPDGQTLQSLRVQDLQPLGAGRFRVGPDGMVLSPLCGMPFSAATEAAPWRTQILFPAAAE